MFNDSGFPYALHFHEDRHFTNDKVGKPHKHAKWKLGDKHVFMTKLVVSTLDPKTKKTTINAAYITDWNILMMSDNAKILSVSASLAVTFGLLLL